MIHAREQRTGHFWQGRFGFVAMDEAHLAAALLDVSLNPVRAGLAATARDWRWSGVHALLDGRPDGLTDTAAVGERAAGLAAELGNSEDETMTMALLRAECIGRPRGNEAFLAHVATLAGRDVRPQKRGRKTKPEK